ncbi:MAG TPA: hypothetical protein DCF63_00645 [Planctomycetaceae bacterium]|nr:hypothetical protein [Planctomycetaceae bacterium]
MKILIIALYFPPLNRIASSRPAAWAKDWSQSGHSVTVFTNKKYPYHGPLSLPLPDFNEQVSIVEADYLLAKRWGYGGKSLFRRPLYGIQRLTWSFVALWQIIRVVRSQAPDIVISTYSPVSTVLLGFVAKAFYRKARWVVDYRDLWTGNPYRNRKPAIRWFLEWFQRRLLRRASMITTVSPPLQTSLKQLAPHIPVEVIFNGHEGILPWAPGPTNDPVVSIVHAGTIYKQYNVQPLLEAVHGLIDSQQIEVGRLELHFLGDKLGNLPAELERYRLRDIARLPGQVPRSAAHAAQRQATLLLLLGTNEPGILHGKLFEYIAACRPVLDVGDTDATDAAQVLQATRCGIAVGGDVQMIQQVILQLAEGHQPDWFSPDLEKIATYSRDHQSRKLEMLFRQLLET